MFQEQEVDSRPFKIRNSAREGFEGINRASVESGIVPQLDTLLRQHGVNPRYWVFDGTEWTAGFPAPLRTRYIIPESNYLIPDLENDRNFVGIAVHELYLNGRSTSICIGLSVHDMEKIAERHHAVYKERNYPRPIKPDWWTYEYLAYDFTRPPKYVRSKNRRSIKDPFVYGDYDVDKMENIATITFEDESKKRNVWPDNRVELEEAMHSLDNLITTVTERNRSS